MSNPLNHVAFVTIPSGQSVSNWLRLNGNHLVGIEMPAAWDAAGLSFQVADTEAEPQAGDTRDLWADAVQVEEVTAASRALQLPPTRVAGWQWVRLRSNAAGTPATPLNQAADRVIGLLIREYR